eukprot:2936145-Karenia_brevis.AAC.1
MQWEHWAEQGDIQEPVWNTNVYNESLLFVEFLRSAPADVTCNPLAAFWVTARAAFRLRTHRGLGIDGAPMD